MGFGYLLIGFLIAFPIHLLASTANVGSVVLLLGYGLMFCGLTLLNRYHSTFALSRWVAALTAVPALFGVVIDVEAMFGLDFSAVLNEHVRSAFEGVEFALKILFLLSMLYAVRKLAGSVGLGGIASWALLNMIFSGSLGALRIVWEFPFVAPIRSYFTFSVLLLEVVIMICVGLMLISCNKNICAAGDEDASPRRSRFAFINRITEAAERAHTRMDEQARADGAAMRQRHEEKRKHKNKRQKK